MLSCISIKEVVSIHPQVASQLPSTLCDGGGGGSGGGGGAGGGGSGGVVGGRGISWDHPRLKNRTFLPFIEKAFRTDGRTYGRTDRQTKRLIEMRGRI